MTVRQRDTAMGIIDDRPGPRRLRWLDFLIATLGVALVVISLSGVVHGALVFAAGMALVSLAPSAKTLAGRLSVGGALLLGWASIAEMVRLGLGLPDLGEILLLVAGASLIALGGLRAVGLTSFALPRLDLTWADLFPFVALCAMLLMNRPFYQGGDAVLQLARFFDAHDHASHFNMVEMFREHGGPVFEIPGGSAYAFFSYPMGYHGLSAALINSIYRDEFPGMETEVNAYASVMIIVSAIAVTTLVAVVCTIPFLRKRAAFAGVATSLILALFTQSSLGSGLLYAGFPNFLLASALLAALPILAVTWDKIPSFPHNVTFASAVVGIASNWALLLVFVPIVAFVVIFPLQTERWRSSAATWVIHGAVWFATISAVVWSVRPIFSPGTPSSDGSLLLAGGDFILGDPRVVLIILGLAIVLPAALSIDSVRFRVGVTAMRGAHLGYVPLWGVLLASILGAIQLEQVGELRYYFFKFVIALTILAFTIVVVAGMTLIDVFARPPTGRFSTRGALASGLLAMFAINIYGTVIPVLPAGALRSTGAEVRSVWQSRPSDELVAAANVVLDSCPAALAQDEVVLVVPDDVSHNTSRTNLLINLWVMSCTRQWTSDAYAAAKRQWPLSDVRLGSEVHDVVNALVKDTEFKVAVSDLSFEVARAGLHEFGDTTRLISFGGSTYAAANSTRLTATIANPETIP